MSHLHKNDIILKVIGHLGMWCLIGMALFLWLERSTTYDSSLYGYMMITHETFYAPHDRWVNYLWQWLPILAVKFGLSLATFLKVLSVAPVLFLYLIYCVITHVLKHAMAGVYLVLVLVTLVRYKFYSAIPEIYIGMSFVVLMAAFLSADNPKKQSMGTWQEILIGVGIVSLTYLAHPLLFYPLMVVILLDYIYRRDRKSWKHLVWIIVSGLLFLSKFLAGRSSAHEGSAIQNFLESIQGNSFIETSLNLYSLDIFYRYVETQWALPLVIAMLFMVYMQFQRRFVFAAVLPLAILAWILIVVHLGAYLEKPFLFMIEGYFILIGPLLWLPLLYVKLDSLLLKNLRSAIMLLLLVFGMHRIYSVRPFYTARINDMNSKINLGRDMNARNIIAPAGDKMWEKYWYLWSVPFESLMHSSLAHVGESSILIIDTYPDKSYFEEPLELMIGVPTDSIKKLPPAYFNVDAEPFISLK